MNQIENQSLNQAESSRTVSGESVGTRAPEVNTTQVGAAGAVPPSAAPVPPAPQYAFPMQQPVQGAQQAGMQNPYVPQQYMPQPNMAQTNPMQTAGAQAPIGQPQTPGMNAPVNPAQQKPAVKRKRCKRRDLLMALLVGVLSFVTIDCLIWAGGIGAGVVVGTLLLLGVSLWYLKKDQMLKKPYTIICIAAFSAGSLSLVFSADAGMKILTLLGMMLLYNIILMDMMELRSWAPGTIRSIGDYCCTAFVAGYGGIGQGLYALFHPEKDKNDKRGAIFGKAMLGLVIALPFVIVLIVLLSGADQAFQGMLEGIDLDHYYKPVTSLIFAAWMFVVVFSRLFFIRDKDRTRREESGKGLDPTVLTFFMLGISLVYVAYLFSQLAYFFNGFMGFLPNGFTHAEYARRGFFELTAVGVINILIVIFCSELSRKREGKISAGVKILSMFLCLFSLVLVSTEVAKMKLYMDAYGLTQLRILTTLFMIFLAICFIALMIYVFLRKFPYLKVAVAVGALLLVAVNFVGVDRMVAEYNVGAYQSGRLENVDVQTITELSDAAVPSLLMLANDEDPQVAQQAQKNLYARWKRLHERGEWSGTEKGYKAGKLKPYDLRGYNMVSYQARQLLLENEKLFVPAEA